MEYKFRSPFSIKTNLAFFMLAFSFGSLASQPIDIFVLRGLIRGGVYSSVNTKIMHQKIQSLRQEKVNVFNLEISGNGSKFMQQSHTSIDEMIDDIRKDYLKQRTPGAKAYLVAISLGGMIGSNWVNKHPHDFQKVLILNSSLPSFCGLFDRVKPSSWKRLVTGALSSDPTTKESLIFDVIINHKRQNQKLRGVWADISKRMPVSLPNTLRQLWAGLTAPVPTSLKVPAVIGVSEKDQMVSSDCSKNMAKALKLPLVVHPTAGHDIINDAPEWVAKILGEHVL